jgi:xanthine dehydrogenase accessory factor
VIPGSDAAGATELLPLLGDWPSAALARLEHESSVIRVIVASVRGSAPREPGACMLVDSRGLTGTIGGGNLEREAIAIARAQMREPIGSDSIRISRMTLGRDLAQCCGGLVDLWLERLTHEDRQWLAAAASCARAGEALLITRATHGAPERSCLPADTAERFDRIRFDVNEQSVATLRERIDAPTTPLWLYGAGHVGRAVVRNLAELPFSVTWVDSRPDLLAGSVPPNTQTVHAPEPALVTRFAPASAYHLVMTHDHGIDFDICHAVLTAGEFSWLGLIGSASKAAKFRARLARAGVPSERIARLVCPIGVGGLTSKLPAAIAAGVTVQLLQELEHVAERFLFQADDSKTSSPRAGGDDGPTEDCPTEDCKSCRVRQGVSR